MLDDVVNNITLINLNIDDIDKNDHIKFTESNLILSPYKRIGRRKRNKTRQQRKFQVIDDVNHLSLDILIRKSNKLDLNDLNIVTNQLGYVPYNLIEISAYNDHSIDICNSSSSSLYTKIPLVAKLYPLNHNDLYGRYTNNGGTYLPFPTLYWLICPNLQIKIAGLEDNGWITKLQKRLTPNHTILNNKNNNNSNNDNNNSSNNNINKNNDDNDNTTIVDNHINTNIDNNIDQSILYQIQMKKAHELYAQERWSLLSEDDVQFIEMKGWTKSLRNVGIAGIHNYKSVKCLHCHYAHHLARPEHGNIIGIWIHELLNPI